MKNLRETIKSTLRICYIFLKTWTTEKKILQTFSRLCCCDFESWQTAGKVYYLSKGNSIHLSHEMRRFSINESDLGITAREEITPDRWVTVYETGGTIKHFYWWKLIRSIDKQLLKSGTYTERERINLNNSWGMS